MEELATKLLGFLKSCYLMSSFRRGNRCLHTGYTAADYSNLSMLVGTRYQSMRFRRQTMLRIYRAEAQPRLRFGKLNAMAFVTPQTGADIFATAGIEFFSIFIVRYKCSCHGKHIARSVN